MDSEDAGSHPEATSAGIDNMLDVALADASVPGASLAVLRDEQLATATVGVACQGGPDMAPDHQFPIMSITKGVTAIAAVSCARDGLVDLDRPIARLLPEFHTQNREWSDAITLRHLLANTSGLPPFHFIDTGDDDGALQRYAATFDDVGLTFAPGERFSYSNSGFNLAGAALEIVADCSWDELVSRRVLEPLGLHDTGTTWPPRRPISQHEAVGDADPVPMEWWRMRSGGPCGAGTMYATASDVCRLGVAAARDWPETRKSHAAFPGPHIQAWGLGWALFGWGAEVFGWDGHAPGGRMYLRVFPQHNAAVALMTNGQLGRRIYRRIMPELVHKLFDVQMAPERPVRQASVLPERPSVAGVYRAGKASATVTEAASGIHVQDDDGEISSATTVGSGVYALDDPDADYPYVEIHGDYLTYFCSTWRRSNEPV